ncbi:MAG TPA: hypothetical protein VFW50_18925 [Streptosporangiaceae bacterium]|nr:hypothetical protein [Streptosporangiaceae bacterium]
MWFAGVIASFLGGFEEGGEGAQGGVGDLGVDGGLAGGLVPQDLDVERGERPGRMSPARGSSSSRDVSAAWAAASVAGSWAAQPPSAAWNVA